jgi:hypothetical protein
MFRARSFAAQASFVFMTASSRLGNRTVTPLRRPNAELRTREHLTADEVEALLIAAKSPSNPVANGPVEMAARDSSGCENRRGRWSCIPDSF